MLLLAACVDADSAKTTGDTGAPPIELTGPWTARPEPVLDGQYPQYGSAGDPSVVKSDAGYTMVYTDYATDISGADTWSATSTDGVDWAIGDRALTGQAGAWDAAHETPALLDTTTLYAIGYPSATEGFVSGADVGRWTWDGAWVADPANPVMSRAAGGLDADGLTSPTVVPTADGYFMSWTGWCWTCSPVVSLLGATSPDGVTWTRLDAPLITETGLDWADSGLAETQLFVWGDHYGLAFSSVDAELPHQIGVGWADTPEGPWTLAPEPILTVDGLDWADAGVLAPQLLIEGDSAMLWFSGQSAASGTYRIGLATLGG